MNTKIINFIKNFSYTLSSNLISLLISTLVVLIIPKVIGIQEYGYWQLYLFYSSYVGFLQFGWNDGIYLRYGGEKYENLNKQLFFSQFLMLLLSQILIGIIIIIFTALFASNSNSEFILYSTAICLVITGTRAMFLFILQSTNRIKEYAKTTVLDRVIYFLLVIMLLLVGITDFKIMIIADLTGRFLSFIYSMYFCRDIVFQKISNFYFSVNEMFMNMSVGIKLMFANIASMLIIGVVRFGIERAWDVETFGKVSLTLSASSLMMIFINAVGIIMFPILRRTDVKKLSSIYVIMRDFLMLILLGLLIMYYPLKTILSYWLPQYSESLMFMALAFPMFIYEGKMALLINTYLKTLRKEKVILVVNLISVSISVLVTIVSTIILKNLNLAVLSIVILLTLRSILAEIFISKIININVKKDILLEILLTATFIYSGWVLNSLYTIVVYGFAYSIYVFIKKDDIKSSLKSMKLLVKS